MPNIANPQQQQGSYGPLSTWLWQLWKLILNIDTVGTVGPSTANGGIGTTQFDGNLIVTGALTAEGGETITGGLTVDTLTVTGNETVDGNLTVDGTIAGLTSYTIMLGVLSGLLSE